MKHARICRADVSGRRGEGLVSDHGRWIQPRLGQACGFCDEESLPEGAAEAALIYKRNHINWKTYNIAVFAEIFGVYQIFL